MKPQLLRFGADAMRGRLADERGVALPLALVGLVVVSLLITTALMTSTTEVALSNAHQQGARALYSAESALQQIVADRALDRALTSGSYGVTVEGTPFTVSSVRLVSLPTEKSGSTMSRHSTFSLVAAPSSGSGRSVGALIDAVQSAEAFGLNITSGAMVGTDRIKLPGGSYTITGEDTSNCATGGLAPGMVVASDVDISKIGKPDQIVGGIERNQTVTKAEFASFVLGGRAPEDAAAAADIRWGELPGGRPIPGSALSGNPTLPDTSWLNWGCPLGMVASCTTDPDTSRLPVIAVRAPSGSEVHLTGAGQGVLIVIGDARLNAGFLFKGVVIVTGDLTVNGGTQVTGSLVALSDLTLADSTYADGSDDQTTINGQGQIRFDRCSVEAAQNAINNRLLDNAPADLPRPTYGWYEVVR